VVSRAPGYLKRRGTPRTPDDLDDHDCLVFTQPGYEWRFRRDGRVSSRQPPPRMRANALDAIVEAAVAGNGLVYAPALQVEDHVAAGRLRVVLRDFEVPPLPINAVLSHTRLLSKVRTLVDFLATQLNSRDFALLCSS
jgi:DNA-binding transcriptional LysR family regulator